ncbi:MAG: transcription termination/antitermination protein NusG [Clostridiales bacterium]|nr:transcription termination/antitermination protein NusG [Clostridiales bacterium]
MPQWYVVHTYSGYENKVKSNIEKIVENRGLHDYIFQVVVPVQEAVEIKNGKKKTVQHKVFPGYVLLNMILNDNTWYIVRNTRGVTSFVGPGSSPVCLTEQEVASMGIEAHRDKLDIAAGDTVKISSGPFDNFVGKIKEIYPSKGKSGTVVVLVSLFGKETPMELEISQVTKYES